MTKNAGSTPTTNMPRHPTIGNSVPYSRAANRYPTTYPSCSSPEKKPRPSVGRVSKVSAAPTPHSPPIATPKRARVTKKNVRLGENADASSNTEYAMMSSISVGRRPNRSAILPNRNAPTGRIASVRKIASLIVETLAWNWPASAFRQNTRIKKSNASSDQPRKHATKVFRCVAFSRRKCAMNSMD